MKQTDEVLALRHVDRVVAPSRYMAEMFRATYAHSGPIEVIPNLIALEDLDAIPANDPRSDIYAVGAVGYNLLTGRSIFDCATELDVLFHVMNVVPPAPATVNAAWNRTLTVYWVQGESRASSQVSG